MRYLLIAITVLWISAHRLPAPIVEESPTPSREGAAKPKPKRTAESKSVSNPRSSATPMAMPTKKFAGTWKGVVTWGIWGTFEHTIVIDDQQSTMNVTSASTVHGGTGIAHASVGPDGITAQLSGLNGKWTLKPSGDGRTASVRVTGVFLDSSAIFTRVQ